MNENDGEDPYKYLRPVLRIVGFSVVVTASLAVLIAAALRLPMRAAVINAAVTFIYILVICGLAWATMPSVAEWSEHRPFLARWTWRVGVLAVTAIAGTAIASVPVHYVLGFGLQFESQFLNSLGTALPATLIVGVVTTVVEGSRERLRSTERDLQQQRIEKERAEKTAAEARLASLSSRVKPHFLFNTLNVIASLIREDPELAEQTVERLGTLLRASLDQGDTIPIATEIDLVRDYLEIQRARMGNRLHYQITAVPGLDALIPAFSVQTLAENALKHVGERRAEGVNLELRAERVDNTVVVSLSDDGPGFSPDQIPAGRGLDTLRARLSAVYGDQASLQFETTPGKMTVRIAVPMGPKKQ